MFYLATYIHSFLTESIPQNYFQLHCSLHTLFFTLEYTWCFIHAQWEAISVLPRFPPDGLIRKYRKMRYTVSITAIADLKLALHQQCRIIDLGHFILVALYHLDMLDLL